MPPKAAREGSRVEPEMGVMALQRKYTTRFHLSRVAGKEDPIDPVNPVR